jgi:PEP-CTERM motif
MKLRCWVLCAFTLALGTHSARASLVVPPSLPSVSADVNLFGEADAGPLVYQEFTLNYQSFNFYTMAVTSLPLLATVAGQGDSACTGASVSGAAGAQGVMEPSVLVSGAVSGTICEDGEPTGATLDASASLKYAFEIVGPAAASVPVLFQGSNSVWESITTDTSTVSTSSAATIVDSANNTIAIEDGGNYNVTLSLMPNATYYVDLGASYMVDTQNTVFVSAFADPSLTIDPSFPNAGDYSILYSPDLVPSGVPEPGTLALLGIGLLPLLALRKALRLR